MTIQTCREEDGASRNESVRTWISFLQRGREVLRNDSQFSWTFFDTFEQFKAILEGAFVDLAMQDNVVLPDNFFEHIFHVGNSHDVHSIIQSGAVFFTVVSPMRVDQHKEVEYDLTKPRVAVFKNNWKVHQNTVYWCNLKVAQKKGLQFYQTRSNAIRPFTTLYLRYASRKWFSWRVRRRIAPSNVSISKGYRENPVPTPNLHHGRQDFSNPEARTSAAHQSKESEEYGENS